MKNNGSTALDELMKQFTDLARDTTITKYNYSSPETNKMISKILDSEFSHRIHLFRKLGKGKRFQKANDWDYLVLKRRKQAVRNMMELADERFSDKYPEMCVADEIINLCLPGVALTFNGLNNRFYIEMAAAIWISQYEHKLKDSNTELAELRSMIHPASKTQKKEKLMVQFPYAAKSRAVIIGGHETWAKAIKPLLKNVRFIDAQEQPNASLIANSEVIWIQSNALAHKHYYKVMDIVRKNNIKVRYFQFASTEKCAEQFAMDDMQK